MNEKILVIDDEIEICNLLQTFLTREGYQAITATSAAEGIEKLQSEKPKLVLLDIRMPGMDGVEAMKKIREIDENVAIIMATAVVDKKTADEIASMKATDYIIKPFDLDYLRNTLLAKLAMLI
ncbi:MAG: response regulator [Candidatus Tantalella remota]|nr:response regulator [Candidatus Tantalella remota]